MQVLLLQMLQRYLNFLLTVDDGDYTNGKLDAVALELPNGTTITDGTNKFSALHSYKWESGCHKRPYT